MNKWHRSRAEIKEQLKSSLPNVSEYEKNLNYKLSLFEIRRLKKKRRNPLSEKSPVVEKALFKGEPISPSPEKKFFLYSGTSILNYSISRYAIFRMEINNESTCIFKLCFVSLLKL